jgi:hypothetical protein
VPKADGSFSADLEEKVRGWWRKKGGSRTAGWRASRGGGKVVMGSREVKRMIFFTVRPPSRGPSHAGLDCWRRVGPAKFWSAHAAIAEIAETGRLALQRVATDATIADDWTASHSTPFANECREARRLSDADEDSTKRKVRGRGWAEKGADSSFFFPTYLTLHGCAADDRRDGFAVKG